MSSIQRPPVAIFAYNRPDHFRRTLQALAANALANETELFIFLDGAKDETDLEAAQSIRNEIAAIQGFASVTLRAQVINIGLAASIISGVTDLCKSHGAVIVVEDDLVTSPYFLRYMNEALALYAHNDLVASIHAYIYPVKETLPDTFFIQGADCWGWGTWQRAWQFFNPNGSELLADLESRRLIEKFDLHGAAINSHMLHDQIKGRNDSWAIRWHASTFLRGMLTLYPGKSLVRNIGNDGSGTNCGDTSDFNVAMSPAPILLEPIPIVENCQAREVIRHFLKAHYSSASSRPTSRWSGIFSKIARVFGSAIS